eukprot:m51a1_g5026 hypothetical protein (523) ;mRNA; f:345352-347079
MRRWALNRAAGPAWGTSTGPVIWSSTRGMQLPASSPDTAPADDPPLPPHLSSSSSSPAAAGSPRSGHRARPPSPAPQTGRRNPLVASDSAVSLGSASSSASASSAAAASARPQWRPSSASSVRPGSAGARGRPLSASLDGSGSSGRAGGVRAYRTYLRSPGMVTSPTSSAAAEALMQAAQQQREQQQQQQAATAPLFQYGQQRRQPPPTPGFILVASDALEIGGVEADGVRVRADYDAGFPGFRDVPPGPHVVAVCSTWTRERLAASVVVEPGGVVLLKLDDTGLVQERDPAALAKASAVTKAAALRKTLVEFPARQHAPDAAAARKALERRNSKALQAQPSQPSQQPPTPAAATAVVSLSPKDQQQQRTRPSTLARASVLPDEEEEEEGGGRAKSAALREGRKRSSSELMLLWDIERLEDIFDELCKNPESSMLKARYVDALVPQFDQPDAIIGELVSYQILVAVAAHAEALPELRPVLAASPAVRSFSERLLGSPCKDVSQLALRFARVLTPERTATPSH